MQRTAETLRRDARRIWQAGVDAVRSETLLQEFVRVEGNRLTVGDEDLDLDRVGRIVVVGCGKAGAGMAAALEQALADVLESKHVEGWVNVPADCVVPDDVRPLKKIHLHPARPAGVNEPTEAGAQGARRILALVESLGP
ncbi:MAG: glycerate-2-kinase family protein, partial [Planctomycetales bacterium]